MAFPHLVNSCLEIKLEQWRDTWFYTENLRLHCNHRAPTDVSVYISGLREDKKSRDCQTYPLWNFRMAPELIVSTEKLNLSLPAAAFKTQYSSPFCVFFPPMLSNWEVDTKEWYEYQY